MDVNKECLVEWKASHKFVDKRNVKKPKYVRLRLSDKLDILRRLESGETRTDIARIYNIARTTISWIKKKRDRILWYSQLQGPAGPETLREKKMMTNVEDTPFEKALFAWFEDKKKAGKPITGPAIQKQALRLNEELGGPADFKASNGWLTRFKKRHGIRQLSQGVKLGSVDFDSAKAFCDEFEKMIQENDCTSDNIYNAVRTGLQWNALPQKTVENTRGKVLKDRVTLIACVNSDGSHKLPIMVVGRSKNPRSFKDFEIPVRYVFHGNGFPNDALLEEWFSDVFLPSVKARHDANGKSGKMILLIDVIPSFNLLNIAEDNNVKIMILPPHVVSLIQPLSQGILDKFKKHYKQSFFNEMLVQKDEQIINKSDKRWTMKDCCFSIAAAWDSFTQEDFQYAWRKLLKLNELDDRNNQILFLSCGITEEDKAGNDKNSINETMDNNLSSNRSTDNENDIISRSMECTMDVDDSSFDSFNSEAANPDVKPEIDEDTKISIEEMDLERETEITSTPSTKDALNAVNIIFKWADNQKNFSNEDIIKDLVKLRTMILQRISEQNEKTS